MQENTFLKKFEHKSNSELKHIITNKTTYIQEARLAALQLLERRGHSSDQIITARKEISILNKKDIGSTVKKKNTLTDHSTTPELYSKKVIIFFSVFFSTIFGTVLLMYNMKQAHQPKGRIQVFMFGSLYTIASIVILNFIDVQTNFNIIFNTLGAGILNEYFWNTFIGSEIKYRKKRWIKPLIISVIITIPFILALIYGSN